MFAAKKVMSRESSPAASYRVTGLTASSIASCYVRNAGQGNSFFFSPFQMCFGLKGTFL